MCIWIVVKCKKNFNSLKIKTYKIRLHLKLAIMITQALSHKN